MTWTASRRAYRAVLLGFGCTLFVYLFVRLGPAKIFSVLWGIGWYLVLIAAVYAGHQLIRAVAFRKCFTANERVSYWDVVRIRLSGEAIQFLTSTGPFLAEPAKVWLLRRLGLSIRNAAAATVAEYLIYTFTSAALGIAGLSYLVSNFELSKAELVAAKVIADTMSVFLLAAASAIILRIYLIGAVIRGVRRLPIVGKHVRLEEEDVRATEDLLFGVLRDRPVRFLSILAVEFSAQALLILELFIVLRTTGEPFSTFDPLLIEAATKFVGLAFFFIPGQMGASEGTYALIFKMIGLSASAGFALAVARRLRSILVAAAGLALAPLWRNAPPSEET